MSGQILILISLFYIILAVKGQLDDLILCTLVPDPPASYFNRSAVNFYLFNKATGNDTPTQIFIGNKNSILGSKFNHTAPLKIFAHGFLSSPFNEGSSGLTIRQAYHKSEKDVNLIMVDWSQLANVPVLHYKHAANATEFVGGLIGEFVKFFVQNRVTDLSNIHLIGHSLGAQTVGFAGRWIRNNMGGQLVSRITALDAAMLCFTNKANKTLHKENAHFMDAIHSMISIRKDDEVWKGPFAKMKTFAHASFFPNGGLIQPGCDIVSACAHERATIYFSESLNQRTPFVATDCPSWGEFRVGMCEDHQKVNLGAYLDEKTRGTFYLRTNDKSPYALSDTLIIENTIEDSNYD